MKARPATFVLGAVWLVAFAAGLYGLTQRLISGHEQASYGSYVPWGVWVAQYIYFVGLSAGAYLLSSLVYVFGLKRLEPIGRMALLVATVALACALFVIWLDLGQPIRFWKLYTNPQPTSMMSWIVWLYTAYFLLLVVQSWFALRSDLIAGRTQGGIPGSVAGLLSLGSRDTSPASRERDRRVVHGLAVIGLILAFVFPGASGALFGVVGAQPSWNSPLLPIVFLVGSMASGGALVTFAVAYFWPEQRSEQYREMVTVLGRLVLGLVLIEAVLQWAELSVNLYASIPSHAEVIRSVLFGPFWWAFWIGNLLLGIVVPIALLALFPRTPKAVGVAGFLAAAMFFTVRANIVIPGLTRPELVGLERAYSDLRLTFDYAPSSMELLVSLFVVAMGVGLFFLGRWLLPLTPSEPAIVVSGPNGHAPELVSPLVKEPSLAAR